jgi:hypothetical protein
MNAEIEFSFTYLYINILNLPYPMTIIRIFIDITAILFKIPPKKSYLFKTNFIKQAKIRSRNKNLEDNKKY